MTTRRFTARIEKSGTRTFIGVPFDPHEVWGVKARHYVSGTVNGCGVRGSLGTDGTRFFIPLGAVWRRDNHLEAGATVDVVLSPEGPQSEGLAEDIAAAFVSEPQAKAFFDALATFYRKNYLRWIKGAKRPETRAARIGEVIRLLRDGKMQR